MKRIHLLLFILLYFGIAATYAAKIDTVLTYSRSMDKEIPALVITPDRYNDNTPLPVIYLLHGHSGNHLSWTSSSDEAKQMADKYNFIVVCADGNKDSWYFDSPIDSTSRYETYVTKELVEWIDNNYKTIPNKKARAITGFSMGGHGAFYLAFRNQDVFGACGSMSGGLDIRPFPNNWGMKKYLGNQSEHPKNWEENTIINMLHLLTPKSLAIIIDCGTGDFFYDVNVRLHKELNYRNIHHTFISRPGEHNWDFWKISIKYHALFFSEYFSETSL